MTGFGKAETVFGEKRIVAEVRSLNGKQLDLSVKLPSIYRSFEYDVRTRAAKTLQRGKSDIYVSVENQSDAVADINETLFRNYYRKIKSLMGDNADGPELEAALMTAVLRLPEVVSVEDRTVSEEEREALMGTIDSALSKLDAFRIQEGETLIGDLLRRVDIIRDYEAQVVPYELARVDAIRNRIRENVASLGMAVDENRLEH